MTIYFAAGGGRIKIGWTKGDAAKRVRQISLSAGIDLVVLGSIEGGYDLEHFIHDALKEHRTNGEWFFDRQDVRHYLYRLQHEGAEALGYVKKAKAPPRVFDPTRRKTDEEYLIMFARLVALVWPHDGIRELAAFTQYPEADARAWLNGEKMPPRLVRFGFAALMQQFCFGDGTVPSFIEIEEKAVETGDTADA